MPSEHRPYLKFISGATIRDYRREHGLTQTDFWSRIGATQSGGSRYEAGRTIPTQVQMLLQLAYGSPQEAEALMSWMRAADRTSENEDSATQCRMSKTNSGDGR